MATNPPQNLEQDLLMKPLRKMRLADEIYAQILLQLSTGHYEVGARLPTEHEMATMFNVSRPVVREALQFLQNDGLIGTRRGSGTFVLSLPPREMARYTEDVRLAQYMRAYEVRQCLESEAARLAALRATPGSLKRLNYALDAMIATLQTGIGIQEADFQFHFEVARASENNLFEAQLMLLKPDMMGMMNVAADITRIASEERKNALIQEHRNILQAITIGDGELAKLYMHYHLVSVRHRVTDQRAA